MAENTQDTLCTVCGKEGAEFYLATNTEETYPVCEKCVVMVTLWAQTDREWNEEDGKNPVVEKDSLSYIGMMDWVEGEDA